MEKSKVYFTREITPEGLIKIYEQVGKQLKGKVAIKISTGEPGGHNFLNPKLIKDLVNKLNGTIVECNTAYEGQRDTTEKHKKLMEYVDVCVDGPFLQEQFDSKLLWKGSKNQRVIDVKKSLSLSKGQDPVLHAKDYF